MIQGFPTHTEDIATEMTAADSLQRCRICFGGPEDLATLGRLIVPCGCRGSMKYVHEGCLVAWRRGSRSRHHFLQSPTISLADGPTDLMTAWHSSSFISGLSSCLYDEYAIPHPPFIPAWLQAIVRTLARPVIAIVAWIILAVLLSECTWIILSSRPSPDNIAMRDMLFKLPHYYVRKLFLSNDGSLIAISTPDLAIGFAMALASGTLLLCLVGGLPLLFFPGILFSWAAKGEVPSVAAVGFLGVVIIIGAAYVGSVVWEWSGAIVRGGAKGGIDDDFWRAMGWEAWEREVDEGGMGVMEVE
ncbi:hypothetical protein BC829DRAFT_420770 [Chytridium lagenaria]|nr:hypothetical protein BC829DRAFT_420770 [Chytridium lagenaria]